MCRSEINPMHKLDCLSLILALTACSTLDGLFEGKEDESKDWSAGLCSTPFQSH